MRAHTLEYFAIGMAFTMLVDCECDAAGIDIEAAELTCERRASAV